MSEERHRITVEIDEKAVKRLLQTKTLSLEEIHSIEPQGRRRLRVLLLDLLKQELACRPG